MSDYAIDVLGVLPVELVITYAWIRMLHVRKVRLYWVLWAVYFFTVAIIRPTASSEVRLAFLVLSYFILPFSLSTDRVSQRVFIIVLINIAIVLAEALGVALWYALTGTPIYDYDAIRAHLPIYWLMHLCHLLLVIVLLSGLYAFLMYHSSKDFDKAIRLFVWFPLTQVILLSIVLGISQFVLKGSEGLYYGSCALAAICLLVDVLLFRSLERFGRAQREKQREEFLQAKLDWCLTRYGGMVDEIERAAQLRHDLRNQLQVVALLAEIGEVERALAHVRMLASRMK